MHICINNKMAAKSNSMRKSQIGHYSQLSSIRSKNGMEIALRLMLHYVQ